MRTHSRSLKVARRPDTIMAELAPVIDHVLDVGEDDDLAQKQQILNSLRSQSPQVAAQLDRLMLERILKMRKGVAEAGENLLKLKGVLERLSAPPWHPAVYRGKTQTSVGLRGTVFHGSS